MMLGSQSGGRRTTRQPQLTSRECEWLRLACKSCWWTTKAELATHLSIDGMSGGKLRVPEASVPELLKAVSKDCINRKLYYLNELHTNPSRIMKLFFDLDLKGPTETGDLFAVDFASCAQEILRKYYPDLESSGRKLLDVFVVTREKDVSTAAAPSGAVEQLVSEGYHVHFPNLFIHHDDLMMVYHDVLATARARWPREGAYNPWNKVLDAQVYNKVGLRLYGSSVTRSCPDCEERGEVIVQCGCFGSGRVDGGHRYERIVAYLRVAPFVSPSDRDPPIFHRKKEKNMSVNPFKVLLSASVQVPSSRQLPSPGFLKSEVRIAAAPIVGAVRTRAKAKSGFVAVDNHAQVAAASVLVKTFATAYQLLDVTRVLLKTDGLFFSVDVAGPGETFCFNKQYEDMRSSSSEVKLISGAAHKSMTVYFEIYPNRIVQRCHCSCKPDPDSGVHRATGQPCSNTEVEIISMPVSADQQKVLFPDYASGHMDLPSPMGMFYGFGEPDYHLKTNERVIAMMAYVRSQWRKSAPAPPDHPTQPRQPSRAANPRGARSGGGGGGGRSQIGWSDL